MAVFLASRPGTLEAKKEGKEVKRTKKEWFELYADISSSSLTCIRESVGAGPLACPTSQKGRTLHVLFAK